MNDRSDFEGLELPPELAELDAELSSMTYEERPSFGPELRAELARSWAEPDIGRRVPVRQLLAAGVAGLLMVGVAVPSARASLVRLVSAIQGPPQEEQAPPLDLRRPGPMALEAPPLSPVTRFEEPTSGETSGRIEPEPPLDMGAAAAGTYRGPEASFPDLLDRAEAEALVRRSYPMELQTARVGGTVRLMLYVDSLGAVEFASVAEGSGVALLDSAALQVAPAFSFEPARRWGRAVETWVEFDVRFRPPPGTEDEDLPVVHPVSEPYVPELTDLGPAPLWSGAPALPAPGGAEGGELLRAAIGDDGVVRRLGPIGSIIEGEPPPGVGPTRWRADVAAVLESAMVRDPDNPAPPLALARLRRKQGLRTEARVLIERGLQRGLRWADGVSPTVMADLHYERGTLVKEGFLAASGVGRVRSEALDNTRCSAARSSGGAVSGYASVERLIAWNYLCPAALDAILTRSFEPAGRGADVDLALMRASFGSATEASPAHVGANVELLLLLAEASRWSEMLSAAQTFVRASEGHPYGLLLTGVALQRLGRSEEAEGHIEDALRRLPAEDAARLRDVSVLLDRGEAEEYWSVSGGDRAAWVKAFWVAHDPIRSTSVNEREVEHLVRAAEATFRFGTSSGDPAQVWIRYGRPASVRVFGEGSGLRTEFWDYGLTGPDVTFRRPSNSADMDLTPEGRAYVDELLEVFPHRYGAGARAVVELPGQVSRFRGTERGSADVEVYARVPADLVEGANGPLEFGAFVLDSEGRPRSTLRRAVPPRHTPFFVRIPTDAAAAAVVVEFFDPTTGRAAVLRHELGPQARAGGVVASDLLLHPQIAAPTQSSARGAVGVQPFAMDGPVDEDVVGITFELYGLAEAVTWYRVRAEVRRSSDGRLFDVPIRPALMPDFRATWDRRPSAGPVTHESLIIDVGALSAGSYTLRVVADLPDVGAPLVLEKPLVLG